MYIPNGPFLTIRELHREVFEFLAEAATVKYNGQYGIWFKQKW